MMSNQAKISKSKGIKKKEKVFKIKNVKFRRIIKIK